MLRMLVVVTVWNLMLLRAMAVICYIQSTAEQSRAVVVNEC